MPQLSITFLKLSAEHDGYCSGDECDILSINNDNITTKLIPLPSYCQGKISDEYFRDTNYPIDELINSKNYIFDISDKLLHAIIIREGELMIVTLDNNDQINVHCIDFYDNKYPVGSEFSQKSTNDYLYLEPFDHIVDESYSTYGSGYCSISDVADKFVGEIHSTVNRTIYAKIIE